jgi:hypothetical protein
LTKASLGCLAQRLTTSTWGVQLVDLSPHHLFHFSFWRRYWSYWSYWSLSLVDFRIGNPLAMQFLGTCNWLGGAVFAFLLVSIGKRLVGFHPSRPVHNVLDQLQAVNKFVRKWLPDNVVTVSLTFSFIIESTLNRFFSFFIATFQASFSISFHLIWRRLCLDGAFLRASSILERFSIS